MNHEHDLTYGAVYLAFDGKPYVQCPTCFKKIQLEIISFTHAFCICQMSAPWPRALMDAGFVLWEPYIAECVN